MPRFLMIRLLPALLMLVLALASPGAGAQTPAAPGSNIVAQQQSAIATLKRQTEETEQRITAASEDDARLVALRLRLEEAQRDLLDASVAFRPRLTDINQRIEQLGPAPADGAPPEPAVVTNERQALIDEKAQINAALGVAEDLSIRINGLINQITDLRRDLFTKLLTRRYDLGPTMLSEVGDAFHAEFGKAFYAISSWLRFVIAFKLPSVLAATFLALAAAAVLLIGGRRVLGRLYRPDPALRDPSYLSRLSVAFWSTLLRSGAVAVFGVVAYFLYDYFGVLRTDIAEMVEALLYVISIVYFVHALAVAVLSPKLPHWRLIPVETEAARRLVWLILAMAIFTGFDALMSSVYRVLASPLALTVGESLVANVVTGVLVIMIGLTKPYADPAGKPIGWPQWLKLLFFFLGGMAIASSLLGFIGFARFLSQQIVITGAVLTTMYVGFLSARAVAEEGAFARTSFGQRMQRRFKLDDTALDQIALVLSVMINILVAVVGIPLILLQAGFRLGDMEAWALRAMGGFQIGTFTFSPGGILSGILVFAFGYVITRWFQGWLDGSVMARGRVDIGVRNSIRTVVGYAGIAITALLAVSAAGLDLSSFALIAGGLSLGIGFGLQNVVSNFVSGLILLAERPIKVGDWIVAGAVSGTVKKISVRATEIETFQRQSVILPNSELINSAVGNWTLKNRSGRIDIRVNVAYGSDVKRAYDIMLEIARSHPKALKNPEPFVQFANFGPAALEFEIRIMLADVMDGGTVQNDVRFALIDAFKAAGIDMPSTPRATDTMPPAPTPADDDKKDEPAEASEGGDASAAEEKQVTAAGQPKPGSRRRQSKPAPG
jgi:small-conductance mechanosensitive channel